MGGTHGAQDGTHRAYPWVNAMSTILGWEGNRGLASHWPCVTDNSGLSTYGFSGLRKGDEHPAYAPSEYDRPLRVKG